MRTVFRILAIPGIVFLHFYIFAISNIPKDLSWLGGVSAFIGVYLWLWRTKGDESSTKGGWRIHKGAPVRKRKVV